MKVLILGIDGYLGWALALRLVRRGHEVIGIDNFYTRKAVNEVGSDSALPILSMQDRIRAVEEIFGARIEFIEGDATNYDLVRKVIERYRPDTIVHFAEQRSAPYSMIDVEHAKYTIINNLTSTLNVIYAVREVRRDIHILKMGTWVSMAIQHLGYPRMRLLMPLSRGLGIGLSCPGGLAHGITGVRCLIHTCSYTQINCGA
nr:NAD-dependent epimerase/dehydratase family protein [Vulcanisaeta sp. JCM 14467]